ncbi:MULTISPECIES: serine hydrolase domain-containing protein [unclassified Arthrobacter]|uniref:serine hydrolase domain-containing protein n=1 Tax=unclassified Arthrobacter TaxID=235627 RepID=UPI001E2C45E5|nr:MULTISPECIES: serine hydrolase domain-containing protein [unclassified Arthrobacter]MCC9145930.1 beta-lactamase family protein [Arthrobacter sp. zg-Y919]MDK1277159.1 serine hydrolase domain-containing protein [Arthrobacter sp. zg.Y919]WIB03676.1 serine hydrolase domain-containing protein [Arthrobacter sp. zg-Y919]
MSYETEPATTPGGTKTPSSLNRTLGFAATGLLAAGAISAGAWWGIGSVAADATGSPTGAAGNVVVQEQLDGLVDRGFPAALASVTHPDGSHDDYVSGVGNVETGEDVPVDGEVRIGSNTKTFTAVTVLQLVEQGLVELDAPVETYLPGLVRGEGIDGANITVRQLLQHTSGLPEFSDELAVDIKKIQHAYMSPRDLLDLALAHPAQFAPGESWDYSNTNYVVLGLIVEKVTQRPLSEEITKRIIEPLDLQHTYFPSVGEQGFRGDHPSGYHMEADGERFDVTTLDPSWAWAAGQIIASPSDVNEFTRAVLDGRLLSEESMTEMQKTVPIPDEESLWPGSEYGLGLQSHPLSCGGDIWGHGGDIHGYETRNGVAEDGTAFTVAVTSLPGGIGDPSNEEEMLEHYKSVMTTVDAAFCEK